MPEVASAGFRKAALALLLAAFAGTSRAGATQPTPAASKTSPRPNIVLIVSDDQGFADIGWNNPDVKTPYLDQLARDGLRLERFYANPVCSVTRAALMTGLATLRTGVNNSSGLDLKYRILPEAFHDAGYQTWMFGKWHLGGPDDYQRHGPQYLPHHRGFDYFYGHLHGAIDYYKHERKDLGQLDWQRNGEPVVEEGFSTDLLVDDAIRMLGRRDVERPFLLYLPFNAVHGPLQAPPQSTGLSKRDKRPLLLANVTYLDAAVGRLLQAIDDERLRDNTLVFFFSDNGGQPSQGASNGPLRGEKGNTFDGGIRVPAAIRWPAVIAAGRTTDQFVSVMDVFPTLCEAADVPAGIAGPLDGVPLWSALASGKSVAHPPFVIGNKDVACFSGSWKLVLPGQGEKPLLFQIMDDPNERIDVAERHPEIVAELSRVIAAIDRPAGKGTRRNRENRGGKVPAKKAKGD